MADEVVVKSGEGITKESTQEMIDEALEAYTKAEDLLR